MTDKFDFSTISNFDKHISESINGYTLLDTLIESIASFYAKKGQYTVDLGCTSGRLITRLAIKFPDTKCIGYDITSNNFLTNSAANLTEQDITSIDFYPPPSNLILSVFTLQFLRYSDREVLLRKVFDSLNKNGAFIVCEKEISNHGAIQEVFTFSNYDYKKANFSPDEILKKESDLREIMNCLPFGENERLLKDTGFSIVEPFFQSLNFKGWVCLK